MVYNVFNKLKDDINEAITKEIEKWDSLDTILVFASTCGGTGSAFISELATKYMQSINLIQIPNASNMRNPLEIYNSEFSLSQLFSNFHYAIVSDNYSAFNLYKKKKKYFDTFVSPNENCLDKVNKVLSHVYSNITAPSRFGSSYTVASHVQIFLNNCDKFLRF